VPTSFTQLVEQFGSALQIPSDDLYGYLMENYEDICNEARLGIDRIPQSPLGREVRRRCKCDLMWLARYFTWDTNPISENGERPFEDNIFTDEYYGIFPKLFVTKDDSKPLNKQSDVKTRLLLWPRGGAKSTFDHVDTVQWILNFPAIRILYLTATADLAVGFVGEIKGRFYIKERPSLMNLFFPEFCVEEGKAGPADEFTCPVYAAKQTGRKESTVYASSNGKAKAGWRFELIKADDAVSDVNSENSEMCTKVSRRLFLAEKLLALGGYYIDYIGTRYHDDDHYGVLLEQNIGEITTTEGTGWVFMENKTTSTNILIGRAIQIKPDVAQRLSDSGRPITYKEAGPEGCVLLLPHLMPFNWCMADLAKDEISFEGQRNQNPRPASEIVFDRAMMLRATRPYTELPVSGPVSQVWDFAFSKKKGRDYTTGCSIIWREEEELDEKGIKTGRTATVGYVQEIIRERFPNASALAEAVINFAVKYRPFIIGVESAAGSSLIEPTLQMCAAKTNLPDIITLSNTIDWFPVDNQKDAKKVRMSALHPWIVEGRLKFAAHCMSFNKPPNDKMEVLYDEFEKCLHSHHHDDIPDVVSHHPRYAPRAVQRLLETAKPQIDRDQIFWNIYFENGDAFGRVGMGIPAPPSMMKEPEFFDEPEFESDAPNGLPNILGAGIYG
jgi:hypothetical protein